MQCPKGKQSSCCAVHDVDRIRISRDLMWKSSCSAAPGRKPNVRSLPQICVVRARGISAGRTAQLCPASSLLLFRLPFVHDSPFLNSSCVVQGLLYCLWRKKSKPFFPEMGKGLAARCAPCAGSRFRRHGRVRRMNLISAEAVRR